MDIRKPISAFAAAIGVTMSLQAACAASVNEFKHIVVIYQENHSFDNLYGLWGEVNGNSVSRLNEVNFFRTRQVREDNKTLYLPANERRESHLAIAIAGVLHRLLKRCAVPKRVFERALQD
jgi:hypothetical protein